MITQHGDGCKTEFFGGHSISVRFIVPFYCYPLGTVNRHMNKEETKMKSIAINRQTKVHYPAYPNAAERGYFLRRLLDGALAVATAVGAVVVLIFLLML